jgi:N-acetylmuramoyl-L-alanine amidase
MNRALSYLIGADLEDIAADPARVLEVPYDDPRVGSGDNIAYCNLFHENYEQDGPIYAPYLPDDDVSGQYGEGRIDPRGAGWRKNLDRQYALRRSQGHTTIELDNPDSYDAYFDYVMAELDRCGFKVIAKNPLLLSPGNALRYVAHPGVTGIIVERSAQTVALLDGLRRNCGKPDLPLWFVAFDEGGHGIGWNWANGVASEAAGVANVGVTYSHGGEYTNVEDVLPYQTGGGSSGASDMKVVISSGHGKYIRGASGYLDEVDEARRVVEQAAAMMRHIGASVKTFHDNTSHDQNTNLNTIVNYHNAQTRDLDVSVHFNAYQTTSGPMGTECLYVTQSALAAKVSTGISDAGDLIDRGPKKRTDLFFLNNTAEPAILIETCFVDSKADANLYNAHFDAICQAIAETITGQSVPVEPPGERPPIERPPEIPPAPGMSKPVLGKGDTGPFVEDLQDDLNRELAGCHLTVDGDFGTLTEEAVIDYQRSRALDVDGIVGEQTWNALDTHAPPYVPPGLPAPLTTQQQAAIAQIAISSRIASYSWRDRGHAPHGYMEGFALSYANTYRQLLMDYPPAIEMAKKNSGNSATDVLQWYYTQYRDAGMDNTRDGPDTLRHLWALLLGLGMRESSGRHCEGRDQSADNVSSDTAEAGLFQTSYNAHTCSSAFDMLFAAFDAGESTDNPQGFLDYYGQDVECSSSSWQNYGSGNGARFQYMCKHQPAFACETCAIVLRKLRQHYGPINREEAELKTDADVMLKAVQDYVDGLTAGEA